MLRWSEHTPQVAAAFHQLWQLEQLCDVTLATETQTFRAHKLLLSACSPYFRHLFIANPCKHPTVFLRDVPARHLALLLEYCYQGRIAVRHAELAEVLRTASSLKIRGLTTDSPMESPESQLPPVPPLLPAPDSEQSLETASNHSAASGKSAARKSSKPKKLRLSGESGESSEVGSSPRYPVLPAHQSPGVADQPGAASDEEKELVIDQPVDFSAGGLKTETAAADSKFSILGSYLKGGPGKAGDGRGGRPPTGLNTNWMESLSSLGPRPASRDSRGYSKEEEEEEGQGEVPQLSLTDTMGIDIAERLRSHFLASLPSQVAGGYNWLGGQAGNLLDQVKREKHPSGGIK